MGAHGVSPFQHDDGADFVAEIVKARDMGVIADALYAVPDDEMEYVECGTAVRALIAGEVLAAQCGRESGDLPDELQSWTRDQGDPDYLLVSRAVRSIRRVAKDSELALSWKTEQIRRDWQCRVRDLMSRLGQVSD